MKLRISEEENNLNCKDTREGMINYIVLCKKRLRMNVSRENLQAMHESELESQYNHYKGIFNKTFSH